MFSSLKYQFVAILLAAIGLVATPAMAVVVGGAVTGGGAFNQGGIFINISGTEPFTVGNNNFQNHNLYAFDEDQNIKITSEVEVNAGTNPTAGDILASHYVGYDSPSAGSNLQIGFVDFDAPIFGIATSTDLLFASDFLANIKVTYENPMLRGLEGEDSAIIDPNNPNRLLVNWRSNSPGDYVRVFTMESPLAAVPLPATGLMMLGTLGALVGLGRKRIFKRV